MPRWAFVFSSILISLIPLSGCGPAMEGAPDPGAAAPFSAALVPPPAAEPEGPIVPAPATWIGGAPSQTVVLAGPESTIYLGVWIDAPAKLPQGPRAPLSLSLVVDGSGSMAGEKIEHARLASTSMLEALARGDLVSICSFSDDVTEIAPPTLVDPSSLDSLFDRVRRIQAIGSTNLHDGLLFGASRAASSPRHPVRRVLVISDGQANVGPSTPEALGDIAARWTEAAVQVSAIGIGLDYDEQTLGALALRSSGRLYHLAEPSQMAAILDQEVRLLSQTAALGAYLEVVPADGVELLGTEFVGARRRGTALRVDLGALYAGQHREVLFRARVNGGPAGERELATARLVYREQASRPEWSAQSFPLRAALSEDPAQAAKSAEPRVQAMIARHEAAVAQQRAAEMLNAGKQAEAAATLQQAESELLTAAGSQSDAGERARLTEQAARVGSTKKRAQAATTAKGARETALDSYGYSFSDEGLSAPVPRPSVRPSR